MGMKGRRGSEWDDFLEVQPPKTKKTPKLPPTMRTNNGGSHDPTMMVGKGTM
jgi:hypothetical protein